ncbi:MAG: nitroreductase family protein [Dehalogenimonas sp.]|uniref:Nitroreductase family protein n=1 Tax=Candidatus Dehalogenimonas loeffleri TaxID=3127115 RepID=A0ABZ2J9I9_9CHLR|nr:nitroreductase family protein [Dehalogenimonas sp.]
MNETLKIINNRRSVRAYTSQPVTDSEKELILNAAFRSPTAGGLMLYSVIDIADQGLKDKLATSCDHQPFIAKAPYVLLFLADYQRWFDYFNLSNVEPRAKELNRPFRHPQSGDLLLACCDALIAAQTAVIAAESIGIGSCYIGDILENYEYHRELFNLPPYTLPITMVCFGHPTESALRRKLTLRLPREGLVHQDKYRRLDADKLKTVFTDMETQFIAGVHAPEITNAGQDVFFRKFTADFAIEMNRSVNKMLENWR